MFSPCQVGEVRVHWAGNNLTVDATELLSTVTERNDLRGAHKSAEEDRQKKNKELKFED